jgi:hypothetical protein
VKNQVEAKNVRVNQNITPKSQSGLKNYTGESGMMLKSTIES